MPAKLQNPERPFFVSPEDSPAKRKILIAALDLFVRDGLCETSIRDIAKVSGFSNPALFKHFPGKDALADYLFERCYLELFHLIAAAIKSGNNFAARQHALINAYMQALDKDQNAVLYVQDNLRLFFPRLPENLRKNSITGQVSKLLESGRAEGAVTKSIDTALLTVAWIGTLQQFARMRYFGDFRQSPGKMTSALEQLLTRLVKS